MMVVYSTRFVVYINIYLCLYLSYGGIRAAAGESRTESMITRPMTLIYAIKPDELAL